MKILKSLFGGKPDSSAAPEPTISPVREVFDDYSFDALMQHLQGVRGRQLMAREVIGLLKRFYEIAYYDHHVDMPVREKALQAAAVVGKDLQSSLPPEQWKAIDEANNMMFEHAKIAGVGSLMWLAEENGIQSRDLLPFIMQPKHGHLLKTFLGLLGEEKVQQVRDGLVQQLILQRLYDRCLNAVLTLHGLVAKADPAALAVFSAEDIRTLLRVPDDYAAGRQILVRLGLLPAESSAKPFVPLSVELLRGLLKEVFDYNKARIASDKRLEGLSAERRDVVITAHSILAIHYVRRMVRQVFGPEMAEALTSTHREESRSLFERLDAVVEKLHEAPLGTPHDFFLFDQFLTLAGMQVSKENWDEEKPWLEFGAQWLNEERVWILEYTRYLLRLDTTQLPKLGWTEADTKIGETVFRIYIEEGSRAGSAEQFSPMLEDWIGTKHLKL